MYSFPSSIRPEKEAAAERKNESGLTRFTTFKATTDSDDEEEDEDDGFLYNFGKKLKNKIL